MAEKTKAQLDAEKYSQNNLLRLAAERAVMRTIMNPAAVQDLLEIYGSRCVVDDSMTVTLDGLELDAAVEKICKARPLWQANAGPDPKAVELQETMAAAKAGSVQAHGNLFKLLGSKEAYDQWCTVNAARPGKIAAAPVDDKGGNSDPRNPFVGLRDAAGKVDPIKQALVTAKIKSDGIAAVSKLARDAGVTLGGYPLRKAG